MFCITGTILLPLAGSAQGNWEEKKCELIPCDALTGEKIAILVYDEITWKREVIDSTILKENNFEGFDESSSRTLHKDYTKRIKKKFKKWGGNYVFINANEISDHRFILKAKLVESYKYMTKYDPEFDYKGSYTISQYIYDIKEDNPYDLIHLSEFGISYKFLIRTLYEETLK